MISNDTLAVIKKRRSIRAYRPDQIADEELEAVLEAALYAPNAADQAWHFTVVQNKELLRRLSTAAREAGLRSGNEFLECIASKPGYDCLYGAPTLVIVSGDTRQAIPLDADCSAAMQNMLLAAESVGLGSCWCYFVTLAFASPEGPELLAALGIPAGYRPYYGALLGYRACPAPTAPARKPGLINYVR